MHKYIDLLKSIILSSQYNKNNYLNDGIKSSL